MGTEKEFKRADDLVRLTNETGEDIHPRYDGSPYHILSKDEIIVRRDIAQHLIKQASSEKDGVRVYKLKVVELPASERQKSPGVTPQLVKANDALSAENGLLKDKIKELVARIDELESEGKKSKRK